ncbi:hypothetical protein BC833DRAFT_66835 [Globomyces pollinis-pini]|nr:hypothetical protein BC833DRAFT_66835 [Globomyces pollinis-pini]KAJ2996273.1 hypothetical protein HDV02_006670 [Globomyces sp. JEL0801]
MNLVGILTIIEVALALPLSTSSTTHASGIFCFPSSDSRAGRNPEECSNTGNHHKNDSDSPIFCFPESDIRAKSNPSDCNRINHEKPWTVGHVICFPKSDSRWKNNDPKCYFNKDDYNTPRSCYDAGFSWNYSIQQCEP